MAKINCLKKNKKGFLPIIFILLAFVGIGAIAIAGNNYLNSAGGGNNAEDNVIISTTNTGTFNLNAIDMYNDTGTQYLPGTAYLFGEVSGSQTSTLTAVSASTSATVNKDENYNILFTASGYYSSLIENKQTSGGSVGVKTELARYATPTLKVLDVSTNSFVGTWNSTTKELVVPSIGLTAGGGSKTYKVYAEVTSAFSQFGNTAIIGADNANPVKYDIGSSFPAYVDSNGNAIITTSMQNDNKKHSFKLSKSSILVSEGLVELGTYTIKLKSGQTAATITLDFYDQTNYISVLNDDVLKNGIEKDDASATDVGATNPSVVFTS